MHHVVEAFGDTGLRGFEMIQTCFGGFTQGGTPVAYGYRYLDPAAQR